MDIHDVGLTPIAAAHLKDLGPQDGYKWLVYSYARTARNSAAVALTTDGVLMSLPIVPGKGRRLLQDWDLACKVDVSAMKDEDRLRRFVNGAPWPDSVKEKVFELLRPAQAMKLRKVTLVVSVPASLKDSDLADIIEPEIRDQLEYADCVLEEHKISDPYEDEPPAAASHPMQPVEVYKDGVVRFKRNAIVDWLHEQGRIDLNEIARKGFPAEDRMQLAQLLGYSVGGYGELSYVTDESYAAAEAAAEALRVKS